MVRNFFIILDPDKLESVYQRISPRLHAIFFQYIEHLNDLDVVFRSLPVSGIASCGAIVATHQYTVRNVPTHQLEIRIRRVD